MAVILVTTCADRELMSHLESAWGLIANSYRGDWTQADPEWMRAALRWRDRYHELLEQALADQDRAEQEVFGPF